MFLTSVEMHNQMASATYRGHHVWNLVQVPLTNPLVISRICLRSRDTREPVYSTYISETDTFAAMVREPNARVVCADLLLPPQVSAGARWEVQEVQELWECEEPVNPQVHCCIVRTAQWDHSDSVRGTPAAELKRRRLLYRMKPQRKNPQRQVMS